MDAERDKGQPRESFRSEIVVKEAELTSVERLIGRRDLSENELALDLQDAPVYIFGLEDPISGSEQFVAIIDYRFDVIKLYNLLSLIAPSQNQSISGIKADWEMPDLTRAHEYQLLEQHLENLGPEFTEFINVHRPYFLETLESPETLLSGVREKFSSILNGWESSTEIDRLFRGDAVDLVNYIYDDDSSQMYRDKIFDFIRQRPIRELIGDDLPVREVVKSVAKGSVWTERSFINTFFAGFNRSARESLAARYFHNVGYPRNPQDDLKLYFEKGENIDTIRINEISPDGVFDLILDESVCLEMRTEESANGRIIISENENNARVENAMYPVVRWTKNLNHRRNYQSSLLGDSHFLEEAKRFRATEASFSQSSINIARLNPLLGLMAVAYLSPQVREGWPIRVPLIEGHFEQRMAQAQVPVLALQRETQILKSSFFSTSEDHFYQTAA